MLKRGSIELLESYGLGFDREPGDRKDIPEASLGSFARGVRVGPGVRLSRLPALCPCKKKWAPLSKCDFADSGRMSWRSSALAK